LVVPIASSRLIELVLMGSIFTRSPLTGKI
jgi:hypothetical protein